MIDFVFQNPTKIIFGRDALGHLGAEVQRFSKRVLLVYGGGSVKRSGLYDQVMAALNEIGATVFELSGVKPNPRLSLVHEGIALCRKEQLGLVLALGGGSTIDTGKAIANGVPYDGDEWDFHMGKARPADVLPLGTILTLPAAGSEMSDSCVITNEEGWLKRGYNSPTNFPKFSIENPEWSFSLPPYQTACGCVDIMAHMMERYFTLVEHVELIDGLIESAVKTVMRKAPIVLAKPDDYDARAEIMWAGSLAHNTLLQTGRIGDWGSHKLEHELSGAYDIAHGAGLAIVFPAWMKYATRRHPEKIAQFARNVMDVPADFGDETAVALEGVKRLEAFYQSLNMPIRLSDAGITDDRYVEMANRAIADPNGTLGNYIRMTRADMAEIYKLMK